MSFKKTFQYRLYPTQKQVESLQLSLNACRWVYNKTLETRKQAWEERKESLWLYDTINLLPKWKEENPSLNNAYSQCLQDAQTRVELAFKGFFRRVKKGKTPGYPRFKGLDRYDSLVFPQSGFKIIDNRLKLSKIGSVRIKQHRAIEGQIKTLTIRRIKDKWYSCFCCEIQPIPLPKVEAVVGIDVGLTAFATLSNGEKIDNPRFFREAEAKLAKAQRKVENGLCRKKQKRKVTNIYTKIANKRKDFAHKLSRQLVNQYQVIVFEELDIKQMQDNKLKGMNKSIGDAAWNQLMQYTDYKAGYADRTVVFVDPRNTSQICSCCGRVLEKDLSVRLHNCSCGLILDRDHNAALNILRLGMESLASA